MVNPTTISDRILHLFRDPCRREQRSAALILGTLLLVMLATSQRCGNSLSANEPTSESTAEVSPHQESSKQPSPPPSAPPKIGPPISVTGTTVYRWQIGDAQASYLEGDCQLRRGDQVVRADAVLVISDGPRQRVRNRIVVETTRANRGDARARPVSVIWMTKEDPTIGAPNYRGQPSEQPFLMQFVPRVAPPVFPVGRTADHPSPSGVSQVQYTQPQYTQPAPPTQTGAAVSADRAPAVTGIPANEAFDSSDAQIAQVPTLAPNPASANPSVPNSMQGTVPSPETSFGNDWPTLSAADSGLPLLFESPPPAVSPDGSTTGGTQFFFGGGSKAIEVVQRGTSIPTDVNISTSPLTGETVWVARGGVTVRVRDVAMQINGGAITPLGTVTLSADRIVGWTPPVAEMVESGFGNSMGEGELYLEGDIVFRQGERVIYAESMYYNITRETGVILNAEAITPVDQFNGIIRVKADVLQQISSGNYTAFDAAVTTSRLGVPRYWLQSSRLAVNEFQQNSVDPLTGLPRSKRNALITSSNNFVFINGFPVLYWPRFSTTLDRPTFYITGIKGSPRDDNLGANLTLEFDVFQLFGIQNVPSGVRWELSTGYFAKRGPAIGTHLEYDIPGFLGIPGPVRGELDVWGIRDTGLDRLGRDRLDIAPEETNRGRALLRHRHYLPYDAELIAEVGWISDRNFLEQYLENEWDQDTDHRTAIRLRKYYFNQLFDLNAQAQVNDFFGVTDEYPTLDHYLLGASILGDRLTWSMHNRVGYQRLNKADKPVSGTDFDLPGEFDRQGLVASTRQELSTTVPVGPINVRPNGSIEATHYGENVDGNEQTRLLGQAGVSLSLPMVRVDPTIQSSLLNLRGLAHKLEWTAEYFYADSDANLDDIPLYDPLDDNAQEQFRRRFFGDPPFSDVPEKFDPRFYALRQGIQRWTTSPSDSIVDDLQQFRLGLKQRFQTKRGLPGQERIVDLFQFDVESILFPNADSDNFGETVGPTTYDLKYHIGDRFSLLSDGYFDWFSGGLRSVSAGLRTSRPGVGDLYVGMMSLEGPISSTVLRSTVDYRLNEKWIFSGGTTYDFGVTGNVGQSLGLTRIGESMLVRVSVNVNPGRDNVGWRFLVEPRFFAPKLGNIGGGLIPPPGLEGLE